MNDVFVEYVSLPITIYGQVWPVLDFDFVILINNAFTTEKQKEIYDHEMRHILLGHYNNLKEPIEIVEKQANDTTLLKQEIQKASTCGISTLHKNKIENTAEDTSQLLFFLEPPKEITEDDIERIVRPFKYDEEGKELDTLERLHRLAAHLDEIDKQIQALYPEKSVNI